jgi:hypothetical protein
MQCRGRRVAEAMLRGVLLIGGVVGAWAVYNAVAADAAYANDRPCPSVIGGLLDTVGVVDAVLPLSSLSTDGQTTTWVLAPAGSDDAGSAEADKATVAEPGRWASRPGPARTAVKARASVAPTPSASVRRAVGASTGGVVAPVATLVEPVMRPVVDTVAPAVGASTGGVVAPVATLVEPVMRPVVATVAPAVGEVTGAGLLAPVVAGVVSVAQPIVGAVRPALDPVLDAVRPMAGPLVDVVFPAVEPVAIGAGPDLDVHGAVSLDTGPRPLPTPKQLLAPAGIHQASDLGGPGQWATAAHRLAGGDRPGDAAVGAGDLAPIDASAWVPRPQGSTTSAGASGAGGGVVADASARPWAPELGIQASHWPPGGKLTGRWPAPGVGPV